ncbi:MAG: alcohol dehydrogenase catalytic domain-containing protein [Armatimonadetes bacterium]|nr:alcohol dehydrogenase catalytic domain-containing protein [Armatimonadota bacterium]
MGVDRGTATLPETTPAVIFHSRGDLRFEEVALPEPGNGDLMIRILACGLCPGEAMTWYMERKAPIALGHEPVGEVVYAGSRVREFAIGDRVFVHHHAPCNNCRACRRGDHVHCRTWRRTRLTPGGIARYAVVPEEIVRGDTLRIPPDVSDDAATFIEPLGCVLKSVRRAGLARGDRVLVVGLGVMGLLHVLAARRLDAELVLGADRLSDRVRLALKLGADAAIDVTREPLVDVVRARTDGLGADVVIVGPGSIEAIEQGFRAAAPGGTVVLFAPAPPNETWPLPVHDVFFNEVRIVPSYSAAPSHTREALQWLQDGFPVESLITHRLPMERAIEGYRMVMDADALKVVVRP